MVRGRLYVGWCNQGRNKWIDVFHRDILAVYNHWTGLVDWTGGLDWWTDLKNHLYAF